MDESWSYNPLTEHVHFGYHIGMGTDGLWRIAGEEETSYRSLDSAIMSINGEVQIIRTEVRLIEAERSRGKSGR